jgi:hypothetical protein
VWRRERRIEMSDVSQGDGWWLAADGKWYPPPGWNTPPPPMGSEGGYYPVPGNPFAPVDPRASRGRKLRSGLVAVGVAFILLGLGALCFSFGDSNGPSDLYWIGDALQALGYVVIGVAAISIGNVLRGS